MHIIILMRRSYKKSQLPEHFAQTLLDHEIEFKLSGNPSDKQINALLQLYIIGFEHYESIGSHKYLYFEMKTKEVFTSYAKSEKDSHPQRNEIILNPQMLYDSKTEERLIEKIRNKQKQECFAQRVQQQAVEATSVLNINKLLFEDQIKKSTYKNRIDSEIENQNHKLMMKIKNRSSKSLFSKSLSTIDMTSQKALNEEAEEDFENEDNCTRILEPLKIDFATLIQENESEEEEVY